ncbi:MAG TPA: TylF/MycF/NovP-related O-methyltransferase [Bradyrhizobium sp.]|nr:TylF/MycF/NovP-related O-methyltransferase [Bradyrhizobium sp.]
MKFSSIDKSYLAARKKVAERLGQRDLWSVVDHWPLFAGETNIARFLAIYEILKGQRSVPGAIAEFGSWKGANLMFMAKVMEILDPRSNKQIHCFDSFEGLTQFTDNDTDADKWRGTYKGSLADLQEMITLYDKQDTICIHPGLIEETLPQFLNEDKGIAFSLIYFDADVYSPAIAVLRNCHDRLVKGGVIVFDEWNFENWPGESVAVREFMSEQADSYNMEHVANTRQPSLILRKIR